MTKLPPANLAGAPRIAITGLGCRLPGCDSPQSYWEMILRGESRISPVESERLDRELYYQAERGNRNRSYTDLACTVDYSRVDLTDPGLSPEVRRCPEPAFTTLFVTADQALRNGGQIRQSLPSRTGVYVGHTRKSGLAGRMIVSTYISQIVEYLSEVEGLDAMLRERIAADFIARFRDSAPRRSADGGPDLASLGAASLIAGGLGLNGPAMVFNSACASSLSALVQAVRALQLGTIDAAIVGGASYFHHDTLVLFSHAQSLSATGSRPFDETADGIVVGEGCATIVLRREQDAKDAELPIHAVIAGIGIASDGKGKSLWAPRAEGQRLAVQRAYSLIDDTHCPQYIEAHATGTQLGDATELSAIASGLAGRKGSQRIAVGSVKSNIGHTLETAGIAGLIKAVIAVREGIIPPTASLQKLNPKIDWDELPFQVPTETTPWPALKNGQRRRSAVNAFGIGGLNVHVVIDQADTEVKRQATATNLRSGSSQVSQPSPEPEPIAIVGVGLIAAGCSDVLAFWKRMSERESAVTETPPKRWNRSLFLDANSVRPWHTTSVMGGYITNFSYDWQRHKIPPKQVAHASPLQFMILSAVEQALAQAFGEDASKTLHRLAERTGVIVGTIFGGDFANQLLMGLRLPEFQQVIERHLDAMSPSEQKRVLDQFEKTLLKAMPALLDETGSFTSSSLASRLTKTLDLMGGAVAVDAGLCSGAAAMECACDLLRSGDEDLMICVAAQEDLTPTRYEALSLSSLLDDPRRAQGMVPGEGCVALILRRVADAEKDGQEILARIGKIERSFGVGDSGPLPPTRAQRLVGHTLGASHHVELVAALNPDCCRSLSPVDAAPPSEKHSRTQVIESRDFSSLSYQIELTCPQKLRSTSSLHPSDAFAVMNQHSDSPIPHFDATQRRKQRLRTQAKASAPSLNGKHFAATPLMPIAAEVVALPPKIEQRPGMSPKRLQEFLVDFVVDQTGYPPEMVEMEADLEADLGLDSIKTAQLLGELSEFYALEGRDDIELDRFTTLGKIERFLLTLNARTLAPEPKTVESNVVIAPKAISSAQPLMNGHAKKPISKVASNDIRDRMISFVVDQTGYPPEMIEMNADLEADLGIDSIKKAQLLGELAEVYSLKIDESKSLDDLPNLQTIFDLTMEQLSGSITESPPIHSPVATSYPPLQKLDLQRANGVAINPTLSVPATPDLNKLRQTMIDFVVDQTGYPPEMIDMEADLEADLGIDSIKKAQLLGELQEIYHFETRSDLTLDDFPNLHTIGSFVLDACGTGINMLQAPA